MNTQIEGNVLQLISLLAKATKEKFHISISECIDGMLYMTLTKALTDCLAVLHEYVPAVKEKIQSEFFDNIRILIDFNVKRFIFIVMSYSRVLSCEIAIFLSTLLECGLKYKFVFFLIDFRSWPYIITLQMVYSIYSR